MMIPVINYYHSHEKQETSSRTTTGYMDNTLLARVSTKIGQTLPTVLIKKLVLPFVLVSSICICIDMIA